MTSRKITVTATLIRKSTISAMKDSVETEEQIRDMLAHSAQHSTGVAAKHYDLLDRKGVSSVTNFGMIISFVDKI